MQPTHPNCVESEHCAWVGLDPLPCQVLPAGIKFFQRADVVDPDDESKIYHFELADSHHCACFNIGKTRAMPLKVALFVLVSNKLPLLLSSGPPRCATK